MKYYWCVNVEDDTNNRGLVWSNRQGWVTPDDPRNPPVILSEEIVLQEGGPILRPVGGEWKMIHEWNDPHA